MTARAFALAGIAGSMVAAGAASAGFSGLQAELFVGAGWNENGYGLTGLVTFRVYAQFDGQGDDGVLAVFGQPGDPLEINIWGDDEFYNAGAFAGNTAPTDLTSIGIWDNQWDTYVTIGATSDNPDETTLSPGFSTVTNDLAGDWSDDNAGWFVTPVDTQGIGTEVLIAQFTHSNDSFIEYISLNILTRENETFNVLLAPAPGALALLALVGLTRTRRRLC